MCPELSERPPIETDGGRGVIRKVIQDPSAWARRGERGKDAGHECDEQIPNKREGGDGDRFFASRLTAPSRAVSGRLSQLYRVISGRRPSWVPLAKLRGRALARWPACLHETMSSTGRDPPA